MTLTNAEKQRRLYQKMRDDLLRVCMNTRCIAPSAFIPCSQCPIGHARGEAENILEILGETSL